MDFDQTSVIKAKHHQRVFEKHYKKWIKPVYRYIRYRVNTDKEAEDLTSQVFLKVYEQLPGYAEKGRFPAWLFTIVRNQMTDYFRTDRQDIPLENLHLTAGKDNLLDHATRKEDLIRLRRLIRALPEPKLELIRLRFVAQLTYREIATITDSTREAVRKQTVRLLAHLKDQMEEDHA
ncbi:MAG: sigma-70 family RNA polymerase sigma factor [Chloroflexota bacterium]|nr:sigma-70 family RNA polymerase sigma factor [Chloroflexota bacterium]